MKREISIIITLIIGILCGIFIPQKTLIIHILVSIYVPTALIALLIISCAISDKINNFFN